MTTTQRTLAQRIIIRFPRPVVVAFGWTVFAAGVVVTAAIWFMLIWLVMAVWPGP